MAPKLPQAQVADVIPSLKLRLDRDFRTMITTPTGLKTLMACKYGEVLLRVDHEPDTDAVRVCTYVPPPMASGPEFLVWCMTQNTDYWHVKLGLDDAGMIVVHGDLDASVSPDVLALQVRERAEVIQDFLDTELVPFLIAKKLCTPSQEARWKARTEPPPAG